MSPATGRKLRQLLSIIAQNAPYKPEATALANEIHVSRNDIPEYLIVCSREHHPTVGIRANVLIMQIVNFLLKQ